MKTIQNKVTAIDGTFALNPGSDEEEKRKSTYADLIRIAFQAVTPGNTIAQMRKDFRVLDEVERAIKENASEMRFEDADYDYIKEKIKSTQWGLKHRDLLDFEEYIVNPPKEEKGKEPESATKEG